MAQQQTATQTYKIKEGDCLSLIAQKFGISDISALQNLNSDQIKDIDLIYAGNTIYLPANEAAPIEQGIGSRTALPAPPADIACGKETCEGIQLDYQDVLYVPAHPKDGKKKWYALTETAVNAIKSEQEVLKTAVVADRQSTYTNLNQLGLLSKFKTNPHEGFFDNDDDKARYRFLLFALLTIKSGAAEDFKSGGKYGFVCQLADKENLNIERIQNWAIGWEKLKIYCQIGLLQQQGLVPVASYFDDSFNYSAELRKELDEARLLEKAKFSLYAEVIEYLEDEIESLEKRAEKNAKTIETEDGTHFVYDDNYKYFTSEKQKTVEMHLKSLIHLRGVSDKALALNSHDEVVPELDRFWNNELKAAINYIDNDFKPLNRNEIPPNFSSQMFAVRLRALNNLGYVVKEQCLTKDELEGTTEEHLGPRALRESREYPDWRKNTWLNSEVGIPLDIEDKSSLLQQLIAELRIVDSRNQPEEHFIDAVLTSTVVNTEWAYYPTLALIEILDVTLKKWTADVTSLLAGSSEYSASTIPGLFSDVIWIKKVALARLKQLQKQAESRAEKAQFNHFYIKGTPLKRYTLVWDLSAYKASEIKRKLFHKDTGAADLQAVECSLLSCGEVRYIRGPSWMMPTTVAEKNNAKGHVKDITEKVIAAGPMMDSGSPGSTFKDALEALHKKAKFTFQPSLWAASQELYNNAFWSDSYHWQSGQTESGDSQYVAAAEAQFMRLSSSLSGDLNLPFKESEVTECNVDLSTGAKLGVNLTLLSGQLSFATWFPVKPQNSGDKPTEQFEGFKMDIPFVAYRSVDGKAPVFERNKYPGGELFVKCSATVYGLAAASCSLSGNISFGPGESGKIGVKGKAVVLQDYNQFAAVNVGRVQEQAPEIPASMAGQVQVNVDLFAGVEAGGQIGASVYWRPPVTTVSNRDYTDFLTLGSITAQLAANYGIGFSGDFRIAFQNGTLYVIAAAQAVCGPGVTGKFAIELNPINADRFIDHLLGILKQSGFRYVEVFGDKDETGRNKDFEDLNSALTVAIALGLTFGEVLMLPAVEFSKYREDVLQEEYAPTIAKHIIKKQDEKHQTQMWVRNLPPETLSKLFSLLSNSAEKGFWESDEKQAKRLREEADKALAIVQIMEWISPNLSDTELRCRQFEETLIRMGGDLEDVRRPVEQWQRFAKSWLVISQFIKNTDMSPRVASKDIAPFLGNFNKYSAQLCSRMRGFRNINNENRLVAYKAQSKDDNQAVINDRNRMLTDLDRLNKSTKVWQQMYWKL